MGGQRKEPEGFVDCLDRPLLDVQGLDIPYVAHNPPLPCWVHCSLLERLEERVGWLLEESRFFAASHNLSFCKIAWRSRWRGCHGFQFALVCVCSPLVLPCFRRNEEKGIMHQAQVQKSQSEENEPCCKWLQVGPSCFHLHFRRIVWSAKQQCSRSVGDDMDRIRFHWLCKGRRVQEEIK